MKPFFGFINSFLIIVTGFMAVVLIIAFIIYQNNSETYIECNTSAPQLICGTVSPQLTESEEQGKKLFMINCAACHKLNKKMVGPSLRDKLINNYYPSDDFFIMYLTKEDSLTKAADPYTININAEYHNSEMMHQFKFSKAELHDLIAYIK